MWTNRRRPRASMRTKINSISINNGSSAMLRRWRDKKLGCYSAWKRIWLPRRRRMWASLARPWRRKRWWATSSTKTRGSRCWSNLKPLEDWWISTAARSPWSWLKRNRLTSSQRSERCRREAKTFKLRLRGQVLYQRTSSPCGTQTQSWKY